VEYTNGEMTGLNKYETKGSWKITMRSSGFGIGFGKVGGGMGCDRNTNSLHKRTKGLSLTS